MKNKININNDGKKDMSIRKFIFALLLSLSFTGGYEKVYGQVTQKSSKNIEETLKDTTDTIGSEYFTDPIKRLQKHIPNHREIIEKHIIDYINQLRKEKNIGLLVKSKQLTIAAQKHAQDMAKNNYFSHNKNGSTPQNRAKNAGFTGKVLENIGKNYYSIEDALQEQTRSAIHYNNMTNISMKSIGVGYENGYRVIVFGD